MNTVKSARIVHATSREAIQHEYETAIADLVLEHVIEIPDRTSPDDEPDMLQVTSEELHRAVLWAFETHRESLATAEPYDEGNRAELARDSQSDASAEPSNAV